ncbi:MAG: MmgE/PrpD family protein [Chloroflexi bacterium]|nr:MmgE/PrpD family protein [Chloroflexota bacterium]
MPLTDFRAAAPYLEKLAGFVADTHYADLSPEVQRQAAVVFMDVLGATTSGGLEVENARLAAFMRARAAGGNATILQPGFPRADYLAAAFVNGTQGPAVELDDGYRHATAHSGVYVLPGALALAEHRGSSGGDLLTALVLGYEVASRFALACRPPKFVIMPHGVFAVAGAAAAAAKLKGYDAERTRRTLDLSASFAHLAAYGAIWEGATVRNVWTGCAARDGILAAELLDLGYWGLNDGPGQSYRLMGAASYDPELVTKDLGDPYCIMQNYHKQYACNGNFDATIEAIKSLMAELRPRPEDIRDVQIDIYHPYETMDEPQPRNPLGAKFSLVYTAAATIIYGTAGREAFTAEAVANPVVQALASRVRAVRDDALAARLPLIRPARVTFTLADGRTASKLVENTRGHYQNPFTTDELKAKFQHLMAPVIGEAHLAEVCEAALAVADLRDVRELTDLLRARAR